MRGRHLDQQSRTELPGVHADLQHGSAAEAMGLAVTVGEAVAERLAVLADHGQVMGRGADLPGTSGRGQGGGLLTRPDNCPLTG